MARELLPLYCDDLRQAVQKVDAEAYYSGCKKCTLAEGSNTVCMEGRRVYKGDEKSSVLIFLDSPSELESKSGRGFASRTAKFLIDQVRKHHSGSIYVDYAVKCSSGKKKLSDKVIKACRPYATHTIDEVEPDKILVFGAVSMRVLLGRSTETKSVNGGVTWLPFSSSGTYNMNVPVFMFMHPAHAQNNRFYRDTLESSLKEALTGPLPELPPWEEFTDVVSTPEDALKALERAKQSDWVSYDCETRGMMYDPDFELISVAISFKDSYESFVWDSDGMKNWDMVAPLVEILEDPSIPLVGQNIKFDLKAIRCGIMNMHGKDVVPGPVHLDTRLANRLLETDLKSDLETMSEQVGMGGHKEEAHSYVKDAVYKIRRRALAVNKAKKNGDIVHFGPVEREILKQNEQPKAYAFAAIPRDILLQYNALDTVTTGMLAEEFERRFEPEQQFVWDNLVGPASVALAQVEHWGMPISEKKVHAFIEHLENGIKKAKDDMRRMGVPEDFKPGSPKQVAELLFGKLKLPVIKKTKTGAPSTDSETLKALSHKHPVVQALHDFRRLDKMLGTYGKGTLGHIRSDGRVHGNFNIDGARSGRMSSNNPNLQNIPRADTPEGKMAKGMFEAGKGKVLVQLDYSQLELRIAADLSGDPEMKAIFDDGVDYHQRTAELIAPTVWGIQPNQVQKKHRTGAKAFNFGILYGMSDAGIAHSAGCSTSMARKIRTAILGRFKKLDKWTKACLSEARTTGYTWTMWNGQRARRRPLFDIGLPDGHKARSTAEHGSWNTPVQGTASDYCLASVVALVHWLLETKHPALLIGTVHDSIMFEVPKENLHTLIDAAKRIMESWPTMHNVPILVDVEVGKDWGSLQEWETCEICGDMFWNHELSSIDKYGEKVVHPVCSDPSCKDPYEATILLKGMQ